MSFKRVVQIPFLMLSGPAVLAQIQVTTPGGTANAVPQFSNASTIVNSSIAVDNSGNVGIGTNTPQASLDVESTTASGTAAANSTSTLTNSTPITGSIPSALTLTLNDVSTATNLSKQVARFVYSRSSAATGGVSGFDSVMTATSFFSANAPYPLRGVNIEGPTVPPGLTLGNFTGLYIGSPVGGGTVTNKFALVTEANAGNVGIGTTSPALPLDVTGNVRINGNLGIGTTTPGQPLDVTGNVRINGTGNGLIFPNGTVQTTAGGNGTITGVIASTGLTGGGFSGNVALAVDGTVARTNASQTFTASQTLTQARPLTVR